MLNGGLLYMAEHLRRTAGVNETSKAKISGFAKMSWSQSATVGIVRFSRYCWDFREPDRRSSATF